ncbi:hypothetical protein LJR230_000721 [Trinickia sp. LjRoot230]|uniref:hypothetical protein n=1 Tax=Trinickia sp. LjRoot230 TaxID=3342288 RepID=UPI003ED15285
MQWTLLIVTVVHVLPAVFWAGSTFVLARAGGVGADRLAFPQLGAAALVTLSGAALWGLLHRGAFAQSEQVLALGAACALTAAGLQASALPSVRRLRGASDGDAVAPRRTIAMSQRIAAGLLVVAVAAMASARYV